MIAQTLHGYDQGHRLLARGGDIHDDDLTLLDRLSDLSGYVPLGTEFDTYHTGFPCGRYYAFACTWPDTSATRAGTVLTHTLLIPRAEAERVDDLWHFTRWHRRPASPGARSLYSEPIADYAHDAGEVRPAIDEHRARGVVVLWFGQSERPVLWVEETRPQDVVGFLWRLLWPEARAAFAFCTFALQVRSLRNRPFDFLALPPSARGSFHDRSRSAAWWRDGGLTAPLRELGEQPWVKAVLAGGTGAIGAMPRFCATHGLPRLDPWHFPIFHRFLELEEPAETRLTAARARADLFVRLWPSVAPEHACARAVLGELLARQPDAPHAPRPLWDLRDYLERPLVQALVTTDAAFAQNVAAVITSELPNRLDGHDGAADDVLTLRRVCPMLQPAVLEGVKRALAAHTHGDGHTALADGLLLRAAQAGDVELATIILDCLPVVHGQAILGRILPAVEGGTAVARETLRATSRRLSKPELSFFIWQQEGAPLEGLRVAAAVVLASPQLAPEDLGPIVEQAGAEVRLEWALEVTEPRLAKWAAGKGAKASLERNLSTAELIDRCRDAPNGMRILLTRLVELPSYELQGVLQAAGALTVELVRVSLQEPTFELQRLMSIAVEVLPDELLFGDVMASELSSEGAPAGAQLLVERVMPRLVRVLAKGDAPVAGEWLRIQRVQEALARASDRVLFGSQGARAGDPGCLPHLSQAIAKYGQMGGDPPHAKWICNLLATPLSEATGSSLEEATPSLLDVLDLVSYASDRLPLAAAILRAARKTGSRSVYVLVEPTFPDLYPGIEKDDLGSEVRSMLKLWHDGWDLAKVWRHWLLDRWIEAGWPPASFLRCIGENEALFGRVAHRAARRSAGRAFLRQLDAVLAEDSKLPGRFRALVAAALADSH